MPHLNADALTSDEDGLAFLRDVLNETAETRRISFVTTAPGPSTSNMPPPPGPAVAPSWHSVTPPNECDEAADATFVLSV